MKFNMNPKTLLLICLAVLLFSLCGLVTAQGTQTFTPQELAKYNGQNGARAYVAVNGVVYDLTDLPQWAGGRHFCPGAIAGKDISPIWNLAPSFHRNSGFLKRFPVVGNLVSAKPQPSPSTTKPSPPSQTPPLAKTLTFGFIIAILITSLWLGIRLRKK